MVQYWWNITKFHTRFPCAFLTLACELRNYAQQETAPCEHDSQIPVLGQRGAHTACLLGNEEVNVIRVTEGLVDTLLTLQSAFYATNGVCFRWKCFLISSRKGRSRIRSEEQITWHTRVTGMKSPQSAFLCNVQACRTNFSRSKNNTKKCVPRLLREWVLGRMTLMGWRNS